MPELRQDPIVERWVIIAAERARRPGAFTVQGASSAPPEFDAPETPGTACLTNLLAGTASTSCPFCAGNEGETPPEVYALREAASSADTRDWRVRVVPNKYPALDRSAGSFSVPPATALSSSETSSIFSSAPAIGVHEVIIDTPRHVTRVADLTDAEFRDSWLAIRQRLRQIAAEARFKHALVFKNVGRAAGASIEHLHSQLMAMDRVPVLVAEEIRGCLAFYEEHGRCAYCHMIEAELGSTQRIVAESAEYIAICPFASRFPYETWLLPRRHASRFESAADGEIADLARLALRTIAKIERLSQLLAYNLILHTSPFDSAAAEHYHWHIEIIPRLTVAAGFEWGSGCFVNPVSPEHAAEVLRVES